MLEFAIALSLISSVFCARNYIYCGNKLCWSRKRYCEKPQAI